MILNKKGLAVLPLAALLFASCSPWKGVSYDEAANFIKDNYTIDGAKALYPTKVHEKLKITGKDNTSLFFGFGLTFELFYNPTAMIEEIGQYCTDTTCDYEKDYIPDSEGGKYYDAPISPIVSENQPENIDSLQKSSEDGSRVVTYEINGKKFKQTITKKVEIISAPYVRVYNDKGYRCEATGKCKIKGKITYSEQTVEIDCNYEFSATYTYAE